MEEPVLWPVNADDEVVVPDVEELKPIELGLTGTITVVVKVGDVGVYSGAVEDDEESGGVPLLGHGQIVVTVGRLGSSSVLQGTELKTTGVCISGLDAPVAIRDRLATAGAVVNAPIPRSDGDPVPTDIVIVVANVGCQGTVEPLLIGYGGQEPYANGMREINRILMNILNV